MQQKWTEKVTEKDYDTLRQTLTGKVPDKKLIKILQDVQKYNDMLDLWDSPYNAISFAKFALLSTVIWFFIYFIWYPIYNLNFNSLSEETIQKAVIEKRDRLPNEDLSFNIVIETLNDGKKIVNLYDFRKKTVLAKWDLINDKEALILTSNLNWKQFEIKNFELIKSTKADLDEDIKQEILELKKDNYSIDSTYKEHIAIDFGVDSIIDLNWDADEVWDWVEWNAWATTSNPNAKSNWR